MRKPKSDYSIQTVANALRLLGEFHEDVEIGVAELSRRLDLHKNNVFRLLATLEEAHFIQQDPATERYRLGLAALDLGQSYLRSQPFLDRVRPFLEELSQSTQESAHLGMLHDFEVIHVAGVAPDRLVVALLRTGKRLPAHCTALGKILLGCCPPGEREAYDRAVVEEGTLVPRTRRTIVDPDKFFEHVGTAGNQGFATDIDECEPGLVCAAAPVHEADGRVVAALSVSAPRARVSEQELMRDVLPQVVSAAAQLSRELGYTAP